MKKPEETKCLKIFIGKNGRIKDIGLTEVMGSRSINIEKRPDGFYQVLYEHIAWLPLDALIICKEKRDLK